MKMTWLHKFFGLFFIPTDGRAKSAQQLTSNGAASPPPIFSMLQAFWAKCQFLKKICDKALPELLEFTWLKHLLGMYSRVCIQPFQIYAF